MQLLRWLQWTSYPLSTVTNPNDAQAVLTPAKTSPSQPQNYAAIIPSAKAQLSVSQTPFPSCGPDELIIKNHAVAINPVDWKIQSSSSFNLSYPFILGEDVAGVVLSIGSSLSGKFHIGDRVMAHALGLGNGNAYGGFQLYPLLKAATTSLIPDSLSFVDAAVLPLSVSTAAAGLFMNATLGLRYPDSKVGNNGEGETLLLWGGASSVGSSVIQVAAAAGYEVVATASKSNFAYCKALGAAHVLDYHSPDVVEGLIKLLKGRKVVGAYDAIGSEETVHQCADVLHALSGGTIASVGSAPEDLPSGVKVARMSSGNIVTQEPEVGKAVWERYVPEALRSGELVPSPKALVVGKGLADVQKGLDRQKEGVSARKVVVVLE